MLWPKNINKMLHYPRRSFVNTSMKDHAHAKVTMVCTSTTVASVAGKVAQQTILKINGTLRIRSKKSHQLLLARS